LVCELFQSNLSQKAFEKKSIACKNKIALKFVYFREFNSTCENNFFRFVQVKMGNFKLGNFLIEHKVGYGCLRNKYERRVRA